MKLRPGMLLLATATLLACTEQPAMKPQPGEEPYLSTSAAPVRLALVLSSGSLRCFAHIGVLRALEAEGIRPDLIVGTSGGAIVGALSASGMSGADLWRMVAAEDFDFGSDWMNAGADRPRQTVYEFTQRNLRQARIEQFPTAFAAVVTDLRSGCMKIFTAGGAALAVQASTGMPGVFAATPIAGHDYADGALSSPLPVFAARQLGAERVIAVDLTYPPADSRLDGRLDRLFQIGLVMTRSLATQEAMHADLVIRPQLPATSQISLRNRVAVMTAGEEAARQALPEIKRLLAQPAPRRAAAEPDPRNCEEILSAGH